MGPSARTGKPIVVTPWSAQGVRLKPPLLVPASEFRLRSQGRTFSFTLPMALVLLRRLWRPAKADWPEAYAILTVESNADVASYHDRQMAVLRRDQRLDWLDSLVGEDALLRPLPAGSFSVKEARPAFAF